MEQVHFSNIVVVGGGTAGWMSAAWMQHHYPQANVVLIESDSIGTIGVGEGTTPHLRQFFTTLGIDEASWMPACQATYKNGITFENWTCGTQQTSYFHPFPSASDRHTAMAFVQAAENHRQGKPGESHPDPYFLAWHLTKSGLAPTQHHQKSKIPLSYAYHFDAGLLGQFIRARAQSKGVKRIEGKVIAVNNHPSGDIDCITLDTQSTPIHGDLFIDASGFHGLLADKHLGVGFVSYADTLLNDSAVAVPTSTLPNLPARTLSAAMSGGWRWQIPLQQRTGNGYVYSSAFLDQQAAADELIHAVGKENLLDSPRHIGLKVGRLTQAWTGNCIAIGLSQGFVEPLEATALHMVQTTLSTLTDLCQNTGSVTVARDQLNQLINHRLDGIRDYIAAHYVVSNRQDSQYWQAATRPPEIPNRLQAILAAWDNGENIFQLLDAMGVTDVYNPISWYCLLAGYGRFPSAEPAAPTADFARIQSKLAAWATGFIAHDQALLFDY